jgi:hypothetical protein
MKLTGVENSKLPQISQRQHKRYKEMYVIETIRHYVWTETVELLIVYYKFRRELGGCLYSWLNVSGSILVIKWSCIFKFNWPSIAVVCLCFMFYVLCFIFHVLFYVLCFMFHVLFYVLCFMFHVLFYVLWFMFHVSCFMFHVSCFVFVLCFMFHVSCFVLCFMFYVLCFMFHVLCFMFHVSYFMFDVLYFVFYVLCFIFYISCRTLFPKCVGVLFMSGISTSGNRIEDYCLYFQWSI